MLCNMHWCHPKWFSFITSVINQSSNTHKKKHSECFVYICQHTCWPNQMRTVQKKKIVYQLSFSVSIHNRDASKLISNNKVCYDNVNVFPYTDIHWCMRIFSIYPTSNLFSCYCWCCSYEQHCQYATKKAAPRPINTHDKPHTTHVAAIYMLTARNSGNRRTTVNQLMFAF